MEKNKQNSKEPKPDPNQVDFKIYFVISTEIGKLSVDKFSTTKPEYNTCVFEKTLPIKNNKFQSTICSLTYNKNKVKPFDEISILYNKSYSGKYKVNVNDNYLFNVKFDLTRYYKSIWKFPAQEKISEKTQFNYYSDFLREKKLSASYTKRCLIRDILKVMKESNTIEFSLFLDVFKEVFSTDFVKQILVLFKKEKIYIKEKIDPKTHQAVIRLILKNSAKVLNLVLGKK